MQTVRVLLSLVIPAVLFGSVLCPTVAQAGQGRRSLTMAPPFSVGLPGNRLTMLTIKPSLAAPAQISVSIKPSQTTQADRKAIPVEVTFKNLTRRPVRILDEFEREVLPVHLYFNLIHEDGAPVLDILQGGKIERDRTPLKYLTIAPGKSHTIRVNLADVLTKPETLRPGRYKLSFTYFNQYGQNCFQGEAASTEATEIEFLGVM